MATQYAKRSFLMVVVSALLFLSIFTITHAASTIGTNMSTTGTFLVNPTSNSATSIRFQNAAGTNYFIADSTNSRIGIGAAPSTTFEVQGTASASYFLTGNTLQVGGFASAAYSRFGTATTNRGLSATNDLLISGYLEVNSSASFDGGFELATFASVSMDGTSNFNINLQSTGDFILQDNGSTFFTLSDTGTLTMTGASTFSGGVSVSTNFEVTGNNRFGINAGAVTETTLEVGGIASVSGRVDFGGAASISTYFSAGAGIAGTSSFNFDNGSATTGACIKIKDNDGSGYTYLRVSNGTGTFSTVSCR